MGEQFIQTLKSRGHSVAGLSERKRNGMAPAATAQLRSGLGFDDSLLAEALWSWTELAFNRSSHVDFQRTKSMLKWQREG